MDFTSIRASLLSMILILTLSVSVGCSQQSKPPTLVRCDHDDAVHLDQCFFNDGSAVVTNHSGGKTFSTYYSPDEMAKQKLERDKDLAQEKQIHEAEQHQK